MGFLSREAQASIVASLLFFVVASPLTYRVVDSLVGGVVTAVIPTFASVFKVAQAGCPTNYGLVLHAVVFGVITYVLMNN